MNPSRRYAAFCLLAALTASGCGQFPYRTGSFGIGWDPLVDSARVGFQNGNLDYVIGVCNQQIPQRPNDYRGYALRGLAYLRKGNCEQAIADYSKAIGLKPGLWDLYADRGYAYLACYQGDALRDLDQSLSLHEDPSTRASRSMALLWQGRYSEALADSEKALSGLPASVPGYALRQIYPGHRIWPELARATSLAYLGQYQKSYDAFAQYAASSGQYVESFELYLTARGLASNGLGRLDEARTIANRIIELFPRREAEFHGDNLLGIYDLAKRRAAAKDALAAAQKAEAAGDWNAAFDAANKAWGQHPVFLPQEWSEDETIKQTFLRTYPQLAVKPSLPENAQRYSIQARAFLKDPDQAGDAGFQKALQALNQLLSVAPWYSDAYYNAALIRVHLKSYAQAINDMKTYLQLAPNAPDARAAQNKIYEWETKSQ